MGREGGRESLAASIASTKGQRAPSCPGNAQGSNAAYPPRHLLLNVDFELVRSFRARSDQILPVNFLILFVLGARNLGIVLH